MEISRPDEAQVSWTFAGVAIPSPPAVVTMGLWTDGSFPAVVTADAQFFYDAWQDQILDRQTSSLDLTGCEITTATQRVLYSNLVSGSASAEGEAPQVSIVVEKNTGQRGRTNRGRFFIPGIPQGEVYVSGSLANPLAWQESVSLFFDECLAWPKDAVPAVLHTNKALVPTPIDELIVTPLVGTQRGRLR